MDHKKKGKKEDVVVSALVAWWLGLWFLCCHSMAVLSTRFPDALGSDEIGVLNKTNCVNHMIDGRRWVVVVCYLWLQCDRSHPCQTVERLPGILESRLLSDHWTCCGVCRNSLCGSWSQRSRETVKRQGRGKVFSRRHFKKRATTLWTS